MGSCLPWLKLSSTALSPGPEGSPKMWQHTAPGAQHGMLCGAVTSTVMLPPTPSFRKAWECHNLLHPENPREAVITSARGTWELPGAWNERCSSVAFEQWEREPHTLPAELGKVNEPAHICHRLWDIPRKCSIKANFWQNIVLINPTFDILFGLLSQWPFAGFHCR